MEIYRWNEIEKEQLNALTVRQAIHGETMTIARFELRKGSTIGEHSHPNEQFSMVQSGSVRFRIAGEEAIVRAGEAVRVPANVAHSAEVLEDCVAIDTFSPARADWK